MQLRLPSECVEAKGVVYTRPWVVNLILDLVGYRADEDLAALTALEPAAGEGAFLVPMVQRLLESLRAHGRPVSDARRAIRAFELDSESARWARELVINELIRGGVARSDAGRLARAWVVEGDYLLSADESPRADVIVGNPPYIRYDDIPEELFAAYRDVCPTMVGRCDIYVGFIEAGLRQLKTEGRLGFICADRWMRSAYGAQLRRYVADNASVDAVIEMHTAPAFEAEVSAYPAVIVLRRGEQGNVVVGSADATAGSTGETALADGIVDSARKAGPDVPGFTAALLPRWYGGDTPWPWASPDELEVLNWLEARYRPLEDRETGTKVGIGVATGADEIFVTDDPSVAEADRMLPLAMASDTRTGSMVWSGHYLVDPWDKDGLVDLAANPKLHRYFARHAELLRKRNIARRQAAQWFRTIDRVKHDLLRQDKLYFPDMKTEANPVLDRGETYPHHNLYYLTSEIWDLEVLGGLLLSKVAELFVSSYCVKMRGGTLRFQAQYLRRIRVPGPEAIPLDVASRLREAFRSRDRKAATAAAIEAYELRNAVQRAA